MKKLVSALVTIVVILCGAGEVWAVDWGECQRTEISKLNPDIVIPACSRIIDAGEASQADLAVAHYRRGRGHHMGGNLDRAIADYDTAIELSPDLAQAYQSRGAAYKGKDEYNLAIADFNKAAEQDFAGTQTNLGVMYEYGRGVTHSVGAAETDHAGALSRSQEAYVWQRVWTTNVRSAIAKAPAQITGWRVLVGQIDASGRVHAVAPDWNVIAADGKTVTAVIRIDGQLAKLDGAALLEDATSLAQKARATHPSLASIEIDHDCGVARLSDYAVFLRQLKQRLGTEWNVSITALPSWIGAVGLLQVLDVVDKSVLQVHAVQAPTNTLFDEASAIAWINAFSTVSAKPFRVSLPNYGARVSRTKNGQFRVESEMPLLVQGLRPKELMADPIAVAAVVDELKRDPPKKFAGLAWFRLPVRGDRRAWSSATWSLVMNGKAPSGAPDIVFEASEIPGVANVLLANPGPYDLRSPQSVELPKNCTAADGLNGFERVGKDSPFVLKRIEGDFLKAEQRHLIGWARCATNVGSADVP